MTPRPHARTRRAVALLALAAAGLLSLTGCDPRTLIYFLQPFEPTISAPGPSLKGKKVVVLTHAASGAVTEFQAIDRELAKELVSLFRKNVKKIVVVDPDKVAAWADEHPTWTDPSEVAKAFEADIVVFLEIEAFRVQSASSPGMLEGNSRVHIQAFELSHPKNSRGKPDTDQPKESHSIYDDYRDTTFPIRGPIPVETGVSPAAFKSKFLHIVANEISWHFVPHSPEDDIQDVKFDARK